MPFHPKPEWQRATNYPSARTETWGDAALEHAFAA